MNPPPLVRLADRLVAVTRRTWASGRNGKIVVSLGALAVLGLCNGLTSGGRAAATPTPAPVRFLGDATPGASTRRPADTREPATDRPEPTRAEATTAPTVALPTQVPPTAAPPVLAPPTAVPPPTEVPPPPAPPTEPPPPRPEYQPVDDRDCADFSSRIEAQAWWEYWHARGHPNPGRLDGNDQDGRVCESW